MDSKRIDELLNRYWECETSLEEEQELREYFEGSEVATQHQEAASLFRYFAAHKKKSLGDEGFDKRVFETRTPKKNTRVIQLVYNSMRIAAGIAVLLVAIYFVRKEILETDQIATEDTYEDPQLAFQETKKALMMISKGFTKAEEEARKINLFNEAQKEIKKQESDKISL
jgi:hypothetical protein